MYTTIKKGMISIYKLIFNFFIMRSYLIRHKSKQVNNNINKYILFYFFVEFMEVMTGGDD